MPKAVERERAAPSLAVTVGADESAKPAARRGRKPRSATELGRVVNAGMRRGKQSKVQSDGLDEDGAGQPDRQFVVALARGLGVLGCFKLNDGPLGNQEIAERCGVPTATVSRITHTLTQLGYLTFDARHETYHLGGSTLALGHIALARLNVRRVALPFMQELAISVDANVGLGMRERKMMLYTETCEGTGLVGLRLSPGSRVPIATSAMGRAYLAAVPPAVREEVLAEIAPQFGADWSTVRRGIEQAQRQIEKTGFCASLGEWQKEIHGVAAPLVEPGTGTVYAINLVGPAYKLKEAEMLQEHGPRLVETRNRILALLQPPR